MVRVSRGSGRAARIRADSRLDERGYWERLRDGVGSSGGGLVAGLAVPDTNGLALHSVLAAELAHVAGVLCDLLAIVSGLSLSVAESVGECALPSS